MSPVYLNSGWDYEEITNCDILNELRGRPKDKQQLSIFKPEEFVENRDEIIRPFVKDDTRPPYVVNTSKLKSPQNIVLVSHSPEKEFVFQMNTFRGLRVKEWKRILKS